MLDKAFCEFLEYEITKAFANSKNKDVKHFICDGVLLPTFENYYSRKFVNDTRKIVMTAYAGYIGKDKYELTLFFGNKALSKYERDLDISTCLRTGKNSNSFEIDVVNRKIFVHLD